MEVHFDSNGSYCVVHGHYLHFISYEKDKTHGIQTEVAKKIAEQIEKKFGSLSDAAVHTSKEGIKSDYDNHWYRVVNHGGNIYWLQK